MLGAQRVFLLVTMVMPRSRRAAGVLLASLVVGAVRVGAQAPMLAFRDGHVNLSVQNTPIRDILVLWSAVGGTRVEGAEALVERVTLELIDVPESQALDRVISGEGGWIAATRLIQQPGQSRYESLRVLRASMPVGAGTDPAPAPHLSPELAYQAIRRGVAPEAIFEYPSLPPMTPIPPVPVWVPDAIRRGEPPERVFQSPTAAAEQVGLAELLAGTGQTGAVPPSAAALAAIKGGTAPETLFHYPGGEQPTLNDEPPTVIAPPVAVPAASKVAPTAPR
jgi:hypothetical protein